MTTETTDYMKTYAGRWARIVQNPDGTLNLDAVARELADYDALIDRVTEVYLAVTAERIGNPAATAQAVIDIVNERIDEAEDRWSELRAFLEAKISEIDADPRSMVAGAFGHRLTGEAAAYVKARTRMDELESDL